MKQNKKKKGSVLRSGIGAVFYVVVVWCGALLLVKYVAQRTIVEGVSMQGTLQDGDNLLVDKLGYRFLEPERYDIIVFPSVEEKTGKEVLLIKRIIGMPGDRLQIVDGSLLVNGVRLANDPKGDIILEYAGLLEEEITLAEDEYFVLGDNRNNSRDSRYASVGIVPRKQICGRAIFRMTPLSKFGKIK